MMRYFFFFFFFFNDTATTEIYTLSLHDALPICHGARDCRRSAGIAPCRRCCTRPTGAFSGTPQRAVDRSEEHTSELQSQSNLVCRLLLEKNKDRANLRQVPGCATLDHTGTQPIF